MMRFFLTQLQSPQLEDSSDAEFLAPANLQEISTPSQVHHKQLQLHFQPHTSPRRQLQSRTSSRLYFNSSDPSSFPEPPLVLKRAVATQRAVNMIDRVCQQTRVQTIAQDGSNNLLVLL
jgi:hypothetical protein